MKTDPEFLRPAEVDHLVGDASKARDVLGWEPPRLAGACGGPSTPPPGGGGEIANRYLRGDEIEIGALHNPLDIPVARVRYVDHRPVSELRRTIRKSRTSRSSTSTSWTTASGWRRSPTRSRTS